MHMSFAAHPGRWSYLSVASLILVICLTPGPASAWQILTAMTDPCHEQMSFSAVPGITGSVFPGESAVYSGSALFPPSDVPYDGVVSGIAELIAGDIGVEFDSYPAELAALSLFVGSRYPDVMEGSAYDFFVMRPLMLTDAHEDSHCLRRSWDDGRDGDVTALDACRNLIGTQLRIAIESARLGLEQRFVRHTVSIDFYVTVDVMLYEPTYRLGRALHTFEDSFSHTLRTDDLVQVVSVMNSIDAVSGDFDEDRDGLAHSLAMDRCMDDASGIAPVAAGAVRELVTATAVATNPGGVDEIEQVLDRWLTLKPGCDRGNDYCDSQWFEIARRDPYEPFIPMVLGCGQNVAPVMCPWLLLVMFVPLGIARIRRSK
ncbi:MAG TPA: hypothetical protein PLY68_01555 [Myxococcota bacterium]|nr:hypothetical protein [Myxococcota bacterium]